MWACPFYSLGGGASFLFQEYKALPVSSRTEKRKSFARGLSLWICYQKATPHLELSILSASGPVLSAINTPPINFKIKFNVFLIWDEAVSSDCDILGATAGNKAQAVDSDSTYFKSTMCQTLGTRQGEEYTLAGPGFCAIYSKIYWLLISVVKRVMVAALDGVTTGKLL